MDMDRVDQLTDISFSVGAVLPAGGVGLRTGLDTPKQFCIIYGRPLICYTIDAFERVPWIQHIAIPISEEWTEFMTEVIERNKYSKVILAKGKLTRHRSIFEGVKALKEGREPPDVVIIHDAVRPFIDQANLQDLTIAARNHGASGDIRPLISTTIATDAEGFLDHSLDRTKYRSSEMPQAFRFDVIYQAYCKSTEYDFEYGTECLHLALAYTGTKAKLIDGPPDVLWKVTQRKDIYAMEGILNEESRLQVYFLQKSEKFKKLYRCCSERLKEKRNSQINRWEMNNDTNPEDTLQDMCSVLLDCLAKCKCTTRTIIQMHGKQVDREDEIRIKNDVRSCSKTTETHGFLSCGIIYENNPNEEKCSSEDEVLIQVTDLIIKLTMPDMMMFNGQVFEFLLR